MLRKNYLPVTLLLMTLVALMFRFRAVQAQGPTVKAVLFYSPQCPHCLTVRETVLPTMKETYGEKFQLLEIDTSTDALSLYFSAVDTFQIPPERQGVPMLVIGENILVGSYEIPEQLPGLVEDVLAGGGLGWPEIPGLEAYLAETGRLADETSSAAAEPTGTAVPTVLPTEENRQQAPVEVTLTADAAPKDLAGANPAPPGDEAEGPVLTGFALLESRFRRDLIGSLLSTGVLLGMLIVLVDGGIRVIRPNRERAAWPAWIIPALAVLGLVIASYLSFVEVTKSEAVCGPVGDCNTVQQSSYAILFGVLPVGVLGLLGYLMILGMWMIRQLSTGKVRDYAGQLLWLLTFFGLAFSIYLTFLEPFVIGATCAWCLTSAVIMTLLFIAATSLLEKYWVVMDASMVPSESGRIG